MGSEKNRAAARRMTLEVFAKGEVALVDELTAAAFVNHGQTEGGPADGRENLRTAVLRVRTAFPDLEYALEHEVADGSFVMHHVRARGTHLGPLAGAAPTGARAEWAEMHLMRFDEDGRMIEQWGVVDRLAILGQLGLFPPRRG